MSVRSALVHASTESTPGNPSRVDLAAEGEVTVVTVTGDLDLRSQAQTIEALVGAVGSADAVLVDLCPCPFVDSSGLAALLAGVREAKARGVRFAIASTPGGAPRALFDLTLGHGGFFVSSDDRAAGLAALRGT